MAASLFPPLLSNDVAWERLPPTIRGRGAALPEWARRLAGMLPLTTASLIELDDAQRTLGPIPPKLRAAMRFVAAANNGAEAAARIAQADYERAGGNAAEWERLRAGDYAEREGAERLALEFALQMTVDSAGVTDEQFTKLVAEYGERCAASMVLLLAYANFQDRLFLCLGDSGESAAPLPPTEIVFDKAHFAASTTAPPPRPASTEAVLPEKPFGADDPEWGAEGYDELKKRMEEQCAKPTRLPIPDWETCAKNLPEGLISRPNKITWYRIVFGYAAELAVPFEYFMRTTAAEAAGKWDRLFANSLFWVTTKAIDCPYCMGHCMMNFEVAGLRPDEIEARTRILASGDWSNFPAREQRAFAFARKLTRAPQQVDRVDIDALRADFGDEAALIVMLNACRYHYMTRISNGFQLTLERENVFFDYYNVKR